MRRSDLQLVRALPLFHGMAMHHLESLMGAALLQKFPQSVVLVTEGELPDFLHVVVEGSVELFASHAGREATIDTLNPVTTFILAAVIRDEVYLKSARTLAPSRILLIPAEAVRDVFGRDASFARAVVAELAARYRGIVRALKNQKLRPSVERLAGWILATDRRGGETGTIELAYEKRTLASLLGMTAENLSRNLAILSDHGVATQGRKIVITDRDRLARFVTPDALIDG
jgi:CRP/FNR family transcriptional regulator, transcriptional activator FtrB